MNRNEKFVITIHRELGSGGTTVGRLQHQRLLGTARPTYTITAHLTRVEKE